MRAGTVSVLAHVFLATCFLDEGKRKPAAVERAILPITIVKAAGDSLGARATAESHARPSPGGNRVPGIAGKSAASPRSEALSQSDAPTNDAANTPWVTIDRDLTRRIRLDLANALAEMALPTVAGMPGDEVVVGLAFWANEATQLRVIRSSGDATQDQMVLSRLAEAARRIAAPARGEIDVTVRFGAP